jgi:hypothetical protein
MTERWSSVFLDRTAETPRPGEILESAACGFARGGREVSEDGVSAGARHAKRRL